MLALSGCSGRYKALQSGKSAMNEGDLQNYGTGRYPHRFTLVNPETGKPWQNHAFRLFAKYDDLPSQQPSKSVFHGVTDANGMTPIFRMKRRIPDASWVMMERIGDGAFGESFRIVKTGVFNKPLVKYPYTVVVCMASPIVYHGYSDHDGNTAYIAADVAMAAHLLTNDAGEDGAKVCEDKGTEK